MLPTRYARIVTVASVVLIVGALKLGGDFLMPLALAALLSFLLTPLAVALERLRIGRVAASLSAALLLVAVVLGVGWLAVWQASSIAGRLPEYRENILSKISSLREGVGWSFERATRAVRDIDRRLAESREASAAPEAAAPATVVASPRGGLVQSLGSLVAVLMGFAGSTLIVVTLLAFMLIYREDLRDRVIRLAGAGQLHVTTRAIDDATTFVGRYLVTQSILNAAFGVLVGVALWLLNIPNFLVFGLLAGALRFVPYVGAMIAIVAPFLFSVAVSSGWAVPAAVVACLLGVEIALGQIVEPWLIGAGTGVSPLALVFSLIFWTWAWGPAGLVLASPLTVCVVVLGRYVPRMKFLSVLLGNARALPEEVGFYQRLLALDYDEAWNLAQRSLKERGLESTLDALVTPVLRMVQHHIQEGDVDKATAAGLLHSLSELTEDCADSARPAAERAATPDPSAAAGPVSGPPLRILCLHRLTEPDTVGCVALSHVLAAGGFLPVVAAVPQLAGDLVQRIDAVAPDLVVFAAVPPCSITRLRHVCLRLRASKPGLPIIVALLDYHGDLEDVRCRLQMPEPGRVATSIAQVARSVEAFAARLPAAVAA